MNWTRVNDDPERTRERLRQRRLADAGDVLDQHVAAAEDADQEEVDRLRLSTDHVPEDATDSVEDRDGGRV